MRWRKLIKDNQKNFSRLHMLIDVFVIAASYALAWLIRFQGIFEHSAVQSKTVQEYMFMLIFIIPGYLLLDMCFYIRHLIFIHRCECRGVVSCLPES